MLFYIIEYKEVKLDNISSASEDVDCATCVLLSKLKLKGQSVFVVV